MTHEAISAILEPFYNEARSSAQASFGIKELLRNMPMDSTQRVSAADGLASADQLLRSIEDVRELLSQSSVPHATAEEFDLACSVGEIVEVLNLASGKRGKQMVMDSPVPSLMVTQNRRAIEQILTRVLDTAVKLSEKTDGPLRLKIARCDQRVRLAITVCEAELAVRLAAWLNADPDRTLLQDRGDIPFGIALMVAGKRLRAMGGAADVTRHPGGYSVVALELPSRVDGVGQQDPGHNVRPDALNILVAEDCDESFALSELVLQGDRVWRARDGQDALRMIQKQRFDLVFMDIHMPGMDGYEVIRSMREWETQTGNPRTPMVVLSSDDLETQQRSAAEFGCSGFLRKPLCRWDLMPLMDRLK